MILPTLTANDGGGDIEDISSESGQVGIKIPEVEDVTIIPIEGTSEVPPA